MGHYWRDMCPAEAERSDKLHEDFHDIRSKIGKLKLSKLTVDDMAEIMNVFHPTNQYHSMSQIDVDTLTKIYKKYSK